MREIKFRAWCKLDKVLYDWSRVKKEFTLEYFDDRGLVFQQYTGLKDANGVEIYEGDIVTTSVPMFSDKKLTVKVYEKGGCFLLSVSNTHVNLINVASDSIQVIGNIYENPELLEEN